MALCEPLPDDSRLALRTSAALQGKQMNPIRRELLNGVFVTGGSANGCRQTRDRRGKGALQCLRDRTKRSSCDSMTSFGKAISMRLNSTALRTLLFTRRTFQIGQADWTARGGSRLQGPRCSRKEARHSTISSQRMIRLSCELRSASLTSENPGPAFPNRAKNSQWGAVAIYRILDGKIVDDWGIQVSCPQATDIPWG